MPMWKRQEIQKLLREILARLSEQSNSKNFEGDRESLAGPTARVSQEDERKRRVIDESCGGKNA